MHPVCYAFIALFPFMILIPKYPIAIGFIYVLTCYPILFLGAQKGQQSNDLLYSTLLPVRKKDIVLARIITIFVLQTTFILIMSALYPLALYINSHIVISDSLGSQVPGLPLSGFVSIVAIALIGYAIADSIFFPIYYKRGKSIVMSTLFTILGYAVYIAIFTIALPYVPGLGYIELLCESGLAVQFGFLAGAILIYVLLHFLVYKISSKRLEKVDF